MLSIDWRHSTNLVFQCSSDDCGAYHLGPGHGYAQLDGARLTERTRTQSYSWTLYILQPDYPVSASQSHHSGSADPTSQVFRLDAGILDRLRQYPQWGI